MTLVAVPTGKTRLAEANPNAIKSKGKGATTNRKKPPHQMLPGLEEKGFGIPKTLSSCCSAKDSDCIIVNPIFIKNIPMIDRTAAPDAAMHPKSQYHSVRGSMAVEEGNVLFIVIFGVGSCVIM